MKKNFLLTCLTIGIIAAALFTACKKEKSITSHNTAAPQPDLSKLNYDYGTSTSNTIISLGRVLFYDNNLSLNNTISCGSCHVQKYAFSDNHQFSMGLNTELGGRNAATILNTFNNRFWDGRAENYDTAVFMPVQNHVEMGIFSLNILPRKLSQLSYYPDLFTNAFGSSEITIPRIREALSGFLSSITSFNSKYDNAYPGNPNLPNPSGPQIPLTVIEQEGFNLFTGKAMCSNCHSSSDFSGWRGGYENIGLDMVYSDLGRGAITKNTFDNGKFIIPSLRNIGVSAPYMHDGRFKTLREVIDHYSDRIQNNPNLSWVFRNLPSSAAVIDSLILASGGNLNIALNSSPVKGINLTESEKKALEAFLHTLTDYSFLTDPKYSNPFVY
ncbi:MAG: cytochrome-c peroxidase [Bacteroidia bacterium]